MTIPIALIIGEVLQLLSEFRDRFSEDEFKDMQNALVSYLKMDSGKRKDLYKRSVIDQWLLKIEIAAINTGKKHLFTKLLGLI